MRLIRTYYAYALVLIVGGLLSYFLLQNQFAIATWILLTLMGILFTSVVLYNRDIAIKSVIFFAPISIPYSLGFLDLKLSLPTEYATLLVLVAGTFVLFNDEKFDLKILKHPLTIILISDLLITIVVSFFSTHPLVSWKRTILKVSFFLCYYLIVSHWLRRNNNNPKSFIFIYAIGLLIPVFLTLKQHMRYDFSVQTSYSMPQPYFSDHTIYGACLAFVIPFLIAWLILKHKERSYKYYLLVGVTIIICFAEYLSYSRAAWISLFCVLGFYLLVRLKVNTAQIIIASALVTVVLVYNFDAIVQNFKMEGVAKEETVGDHLNSVTNLKNDASNLERVNRWVCAARMFKEKPLTGFGPGTYQYEYDQFQSVDYMTRISTHGGDKGHAHSEYLGALAEYGIFGFINFIVMVFYSVHLALLNLKRYQKDKRKFTIIFGAISGLITFYIHGLFNGFLDYDKMAILVFGSLSILLYYDLEYRREKDHLKGVETNIE